MANLPKKQRLYLFLNEEQHLELEGLAALGYAVDQLAMYFKMDKAAFALDAEDDESPIYYSIARGKLKSLAAEQLAILKSAEGGNISASQQLAHIRRNRGWVVSKQEIFGGFEHEKTLRVLEEWIEGGCKTDISKEESIYLEALTMMNAMDRKLGRRNTINFFTKPPYGLKLSRASEMYDEAINLFNADRNLDKKAIKSKYADQIEEMMIIVKDNASTSKDAEVFGDLTMKAAKLRGLDEKEPEALPKELYIRPVRLFTLDPEQIGLAKTDRQAIARQIEALDIPEADKLRVKADALIENINFEDIIDELEEESKS